MLALLRSSKSRQRKGEVVRMEILDFLCLPPQLVSLLPCFPEFDPICVPPPANPPPHLWGRFMSMCLHYPPPRCLLVQAEPWNVYSSRRVLRPWVSVAVSLSSFLVPSSLGLTLMWKALARPLGSTVCTVFFA